MSGGLASARLVRLDDEPELAASIPTMVTASWPRPLLEGRPDHVTDVMDLSVVRAPQHQVVMVAGDQVLGVGLSVPLSWDGDTATLPQGWDGAVAAAAAFAERGAGEASAVCVLSITITDAGIRGLHRRILEGLKAAAGAAGAGALIAPVRPTLKDRYPLIPMEQYLRWRTPAGDAFDAEVRRHLDAGGRQAHVAEPSMTITGPVAQWEDWTGLALPGSGDHVIPGGLVPLQVDRATGTASYREPSVWIIHPVD